MTDQPLTDFSVLCEITQIPIGTCACARCRPDLKQYQPVPEVWMRSTPTTANMIVLPLEIPSTDEMVEGLFEAVKDGVKLELVDMVGELCERTHHREPYFLTLTGPTLHHSTIAPPLILQLLDAVEPSSSAESGSGVARVAASRPAAAIDAIDTAVRIEADAARWHRMLRNDDAGETVDLVRRLLPFALTDHQIAKDIKRWWTWARVATGWDRPAWQPDNTCPLCGVRGTLRVRVVEQLATCTNDTCRETWDSENIGLLAEHIKSENHETEEVNMADDKARYEEQQLGAGVLDLLEGSEWLDRHEAAVAKKVLDQIREAHPVVAGDLDLVNSIRDEWGIKAEKEAS